MSAELNTYCFRWVSPAIWPHAVVDIFAVHTTDDRAKVTCHACLHALGSQKYPPTRHHTAADTLAAEDRVRAEDGHLGGRA